MDLDNEQLAVAATEFEAKDDNVATSSASPLLANPTDLLPALIRDREATILRAMEDDPIDYAELESAVAGAGRFRLELSPTLDAANGRLIEWRKTSLRSMWEFADVAYFLRCFHTDELLESLPKCDTSDLERLLLDTSSNGLAGTLHIALIKLVWPRLPARDDNWFRLLLNNLSATDGLVEGSWNGALRTMLINEEEDGKIATDLQPNHSNQTIQNKMMLLHILTHLVFDVKHPGVMSVVQENPESWQMQPACWYEHEVTKVRHEFYYFTDIEVGCLLGEHWQVEVSDTAVDAIVLPEDDTDTVADPSGGEEETLGDNARSQHESHDSADVLPKKRKGNRGPKRGKKKSVFGRPDSDSDTDEEVTVKDEPTIATVSLGGRVRKQTQHFQPPPAPKTKKPRKKAGAREVGKGGRGGRRGGRGKGRGRGGRAHGKERTTAARQKTSDGRDKKTSKKSAKPSKPPPKMESRWKTHAIGLDELEALLFSEDLDRDVATMIKEVWLPEGQQKIKQRQRQSRRMNAQLKALSFGDSGGFGDPLGVHDTSGGRRRRAAVNYSEAAYDHQINEAIRESNRDYRRGGGSSTRPSEPQPARKRGIRTTRQGRGMGDEIQEVVDKILSTSTSDRSVVLGHVLASLQKKDRDNIFANPVDTTLVFDYLDVVEEPMDLKTMSSKLKARSYRSCAAFERDLALVVSNCRAYNEPESIYCTAATELESWGATLFEHLRNNDMLPPDDATHSSDEDESSSSSSDDEDEGSSFVAPADAQTSPGAAHANHAGWRQSATAFLHDQPSSYSPAGAKAPEQADIVTNLQSGNPDSSDDSSDDSSEDSDSSDGEARGLSHSDNALSTVAGRSFAAASAPALTGVVEQGQPRFTLGPRFGSAQTDQGSATGLQ